MITKNRDYLPDQIFFNESEDIRSKYSENPKTFLNKIKKNSIGSIEKRVKFYKCVWKICSKPLSIERHEIIEAAQVKNAKNTVEKVNNSVLKLLTGFKNLINMITKY